MTSRVIPSHYNHGKQPLDVMKEFMSKEAYEGFLVGNVIKYVMRYAYKDGLKDIVKAIDYLEMLRDNLEENEPLQDVNGKDIPYVLTDNEQTDVIIDETPIKTISNTKTTTSIDGSKNKRETKLF